MYTISIDYIPNLDIKRMLVWIQSPRYNGEYHHECYVEYDDNRWYIEDNESGRELTYLLMIHCKNPHNLLDFLWNNSNLKIEI